MSEEGVIKRICDNMRLYYASKDTEYDYTFTEWAEENGYDDDEDILEQVGDFELAEFVGEDAFKGKFPLSFIGEKEEEDEIFDWVKQWSDRAYVAVFDVKYPQLTAQSFECTEKELEEMVEEYKKQCPAIYTAGMKEDDAFNKALLIGRKDGLNYAELAVHDYFRSRVKNMDTDAGGDGNPDNDPWFTEQHVAFVKSLGGNPSELTQNLVKSWGHRCCPKLLYLPICCIDDSMEIILNYMESCLDWVLQSVKSSKTICPFQVDLCIATGKPVITEVKQGADAILGFLKTKEENNDDDDDDDEKGGDKKEEKPALEFVECIQNIPAKLEANKLQYVKSSFNGSDGGKPKTRFYGEMLKELAGKLDKNTYPLKGAFEYPHRARFIMMVDRRDKENTDDVFMYVPPEICRDIPSNYLPEWFVSASKATLLPDLEYGDGKNAMKEANRTNKGKESKEKLLRANISTTSHVKGGLITFSFIAEAEDRIKVYLYWNGQMQQFLAEDITKVLPKIFHMESAKGGKCGDINKAFVEKKAGKREEAMAAKLKDKWLVAFQNKFYKEPEAK